MPVTFSVWEDYQGIASKMQALTPFGVGAFLFLVKMHNYHSFIFKNYFQKTYYRLVWLAFLFLSQKSIDICHT